MAIQSIHREKTEEMTRRSHRSFGFSLTEVLIVISIIALLIGVGVGVMAGFQDTAQEKAAMALISEVMNAETEYRARTGRSMASTGSSLSSNLGSRTTVAANAGPNENTGALTNISEMDSIEAFVWQALSVPESRQLLLAAAGPSELVDQDGDGFLEIIDPWGNNLEFSSGGTTGAGFGPTASAPFMMSFGPDGDPGTYDNTGQPADEAAQDNILSFELE